MVRFSNVFEALTKFAVHRDLADKRACYLKLNLRRNSVTGDVVGTEASRIAQRYAFDLVRHIDYVKRNENG